MGTQARSAAAAAGLQLGTGLRVAEDADAIAERMLAGLGDRETWARITNTVNDSQQNRADEPRVARAVITMDFERPRFRIETTGPGLHVVRVIDGENSWQLTRVGKLEPVPAQRYDDEMRWYRARVYRTLHRIAKRDPALTLRLGAPGRLETTG